MIDPRLEELLQLEMDGQATKAQKAELQDRLSASPDTEGLRDDLAELQRVLSSTRDVETPAGLRENILAGVAAVQPPWSLDETRGRTARNPQADPRGRNAAQRFLDSLREGLRPREAFAFGLGAAACLVIVFLAGWDRFESIRFPDNALPGSMVPLDSHDAPAPIDHGTIEVDGQRTEARLFRTGEHVRLVVQVETRRAKWIEIIYEPAALKTLGIAQSPEGNPMRATIFEERIALSHTGSGQYSITFEELRPASSTILVNIAVQGQTQEIQLQTRK